MWHYRTNNNEGGFSLVELLIVITVMGAISTAIFTFFNSSFSQYLGMQQDSTTYGDLAFQSQRVASVVRTATDINSASAYDLNFYAYFWPQDAYVSKVHYYLINNNSKLVADVTPMSANPPLGTPMNDKTKNYIILENFNYSSSSNLFTFLDSAGSTLSMPVTDLYTIKGVKINLAVPIRTNTPTTESSSISVQVTLRNRKTNL